MKRVNGEWSELGWQVVGALFAAGVIIAIAAIAYRGETTRDLFTASPCTADPQGAKCAAQREEVARAEPIRNPCISYQRVTGGRGENCPRRFTERRAVELHVGGGAGNSGSEGGEAPAPGGSHPASSPGGGGDTGQPAPADPTGPRHEPGPGGGGGSQPPTSTPPASSPATTPTDPASTQPKPPIREGVQSVLEDAGSTIKGAGEAVTALPCDLQAQLLGAC